MCRLLVGVQLALLFDTNSDTRCARLAVVAAVVNDTSHDDELLIAVKCETTTIFGRSLWQADERVKEKIGMRNSSILLDTRLKRARNDQKNFFEQNQLNDAQQLAIARRWSQPKTN